MKRRHRRQSARRRRADERADAAIRDGVAARHASDDVRAPMSGLR